MRPGDVFEGRYRIIEQLGVGGYGTVWLAEHAQIEQRVAIKVLLEPGTDPRFLREAQILARLRCDNTVRILDYGETSDGYAFMISEYVEGETLDVVRQSGPLPPDDVEQIMIGVLTSLDEAHEQGIVHRDIKPANVMRLPDGQIKVLDFGIARISAEADVEALTSAGVVLGTPRYLAPECLLGSTNVSPAADIFAVGLIAHALLTGHEANTGLSSREIVAQHLSIEPYVLPADIDAPDHLREWVRIATLKRSDQRFTNARVALDALTGRMVPDPRKEAEPDGLREIELDLGDEVAPGVEQRDPRAPRAPVRPPPSARHAPPARDSLRWWHMVAALCVILGFVGGTAVALDFVDVSDVFGADVEATVEDDPPGVIATYKEAKEAFAAGRWFEALALFQQIEAQPDTHTARDLARQDYIGRVIAKVLEEAVDARERANSKDHLEAAAAAPRRLLQIYPEHEAIREVLLSISSTEEPATGTTPERRAPKRPKKRQERRIQIDEIN